MHAEYFLNKKNRGNNNQYKCGHGYPHSRYNMNY